MTDCILVIDFGGQYCHLIARRIRELKVYSEIVAADVTPEEIEKYGERFDVKGLVLSGGPSSVHEKNAPVLDRRILDMDLGILGLCYGHQLIAHLDGGSVRSRKSGEYGVMDVRIDKAVGVLKGLGSKETVWMSHGDTVLSVPDGYDVIAHTKTSPVAAYGHKTKRIYGLQWHPEVVHTKNGKKMLRNFVFNVCGCKANWEMEDFVAGAVADIKRTIGKNKAVIALSGGVDSSVAALLVSKAIGRNLVSVFVDTGCMRKNEPEIVKRIFTKDFKLNFRLVDAKREFFDALKGIEDPEEKRKVIGKTFIRVFEKEARKIKARFLVQGTIYPDRIESGINKACTIKSHHNVGGLPSRLKLKIVEPLKDLYKDEVRNVALRLGLPDEIAQRHPFPGPGLAIRVLGEVTPGAVEIVRSADAIVKEEIRRAGIGKRLWQFFAVLMPIKTVGVQGDVRTYKNIIALRVVESTDGMTARFSKLPYDVLEKVSTRITNEIPQVNRVVYDITHKPPSTVEWE